MIINGTADKPSSTGFEGVNDPRIMGAKCVDPLPSASARSTYAGQGSQTGVGALLNNNRQRDERILVEENRIYARGFKIMIILALLACYYDICLINTAYAEGFVTSEYSFGVIQSGLILAIGCVAICGACAVAFCRRGIVSTNTKIAQADSFPVGWALAWSLGAGLSVCGGLFLCEVLAQLQIIGFDQVFWVADAFSGLFVGVCVFALCFLAFWLSFRSARKRRDKMLEGVVED